MYILLNKTIDENCVNYLLDLGIDIKKVYNSYAIFYKQEIDALELIDDYSRSLTLKR